MCQRQQRRRTTIVVYSKTLRYGCSLKNEGCCSLSRFPISIRYCTCCRYFGCFQPATRSAAEITAVNKRCLVAFSLELNPVEFIGSTCYFSVVVATVYNGLILASCSITHPGIVIVMMMRLLLWNGVDSLRLLRRRLSQQSNIRVLGFQR